MSKHGAYTHLANEYVLGHWSGWTNIILQFIESQIIASVFTLDHTPLRNTSFSNWLLAVIRHLKETAIWDVVATKLVSLMLGVVHS